MWVAQSIGPFVAINCATIPKDLAESTGHIKGAFSGAIKDQLGYFEMAQGGTLFLDELGELPLDMQSKLLRALEEIRQVGSSNTLEPMFGSFLRPIAISWRPSRISLSEKIFTIAWRYTVMPPLRSARRTYPSWQDISWSSSPRKWARWPRLSNSAIQKLMAHDFPGNIRELKNVIEQPPLSAPDRASGPEMYSLLANPSTLTDVQAKRIDHQSKETAGYALGEQESMPSMWNHASASPIANVENFWGLRSIQQLPPQQDVPIWVPGKNWCQTKRLLYTRPPSLSSTLIEIKASRESWHRKRLGSMGEVSLERIRQRTDNSAFED